MRFKPGESNVAEADMTPMIDIVFQLIAFFMIVTNFEQTQADERVVLPTDSLARPPEAPRKEEYVVNIGFLRDKSGAKLDDAAYVFVPGDDPVPLANFKSTLETEARVYEEFRGVAPVDRTLSIRADQTTPSGIVQELIKMARDVGFVQIALKATVDPDN